MRSTPVSRAARGRWLLAVGASLLLGSTAALAEVASPKVSLVPVTVPLGDPSRDYPQFASAMDLASQGYVEKEFFIEGKARRYDTPELNNAILMSSGHPYRTRLLVRHPTSAKKFNGVVIVEWLNVTAGHDLDVLWLTTAEHLMRQGYAYVGVSAQQVGLNAPLTGLRSWSPTRYSSLDVTDGGSILDDSLSFDIYSQAVQAVRNAGSSKALGPLKPVTVIAAGASQSQSFLRRYHNSVEPLTEGLIDGYFMYIGVAGTLRTDLKPKVFSLDTETDVLLLGRFPSRQADSEKLRTWEVAGASHVGYSNPSPRAPIMERDQLPVADNSQCTLPALSHVPTAHVARAGVDHLTRWVIKGTPPPTAPRIEIASANQAGVTAARDAYGNALGGIRLAEHAVPIATNTGLNAGPGYCFLNGSHVRFSDDVLRDLYWTPGQYVHKVTQVTMDNLKAGYITPADAVATVRQAAKREISKRRQ